MNTNIVSILYEHAASQPEKIALITLREKITFKELAAEVRACAAYLYSKGIRAGDRVLVFVPLSTELYGVLLALWHCGATAVFLDAWAGRKRLEQAASCAGCRGFIGTFKAHIFRLVSKEIRRIPVKLFSGRHIFKSESASAPAIAETDNDAVALITFTTGSTGVPKAAKRTHGFLLAQHKVITRHLKPGPADVDMVTLPIFVLTNVAAGITSVLPPFNPAKPEKIDPRRICATIDACAVSSTAGSPVFYEKLADYVIAHSEKRPSLEKIFLGGAPVFPRLAEKLIRAFPQTDIEIVYGSTEAEPISMIKAKDLIMHNKDVQTSGLLVGTPISSISLRIIKIQDGPVSVSDQKMFDKLRLTTGEIGEICVSGEHVLKEYFRNDNAQSMNKINTGSAIWHRTGDAGYLDEQGSLFLVGRVKQRFIHDDKQWFMIPLEEGFSRHSAVHLGAFIKINTTLVAIVEAEKNRLTAGDILRHCKENRMPVPGRVIFRKIPRDPRHNSKIDYDRLLITLKKI